MSPEFEALKQELTAYAEQHNARELRLHQELRDQGKEIARLKAQVEDIHREMNIRESRVMRLEDLHMLQSHEGTDRKAKALPSPPPPLAS